MGLVQLSQTSGALLRRERQWLQIGRRVNAAGVGPLPREKRLESSLASV